MKKSLWVLVVLLVCGSCSVVVREAYAKPLIDSLNINESKGELELWGSFGSDNAVFLQYTSLKVLQSSLSYLRCSIPDIGPGCCGMLVVVADNISSDPRLITQWAFSASAFGVEYQSDGGETITWDSLCLRFRGDLLQMIRQHGATYFILPSERWTYNRQFAGGVIGLRGGGLLQGSLDSTIRGSIGVGVNLWQPLLHVTNPWNYNSGASFNPDLSVARYDPHQMGGIYIEPLDGDTTTHFLPPDSLLWLAFYGPIHISPFCVVQFQQPLEVWYSHDSVNQQNGWFNQYDTGSTQVNCAATWNTGESSHLTASEKSFIIVDTDSVPFPHVETIKMLMTNAPNIIDTLDIRYTALEQVGENAFDVHVVAHDIPIKATTAGVIATFDSSDHNQTFVASYHHAAHLNQSGDWLFSTDTLSTAPKGSPTFSLGFLTTPASVPIQPTHFTPSRAGYLLKDKFDFLKQSGVEELTDMLGRRVSIKQLTSPTSLQATIYFARLSNGQVMKLVNVADR